MKPLDPRLLRYARATRGYLALCVVLGAAARRTRRGHGDAARHATITAVYRHGRRRRPSPTAWAGSAVVVAARAALAWAQEAAATRAAVIVKSQLRTRLLAKVAALGPGRTDPGELVTLATRGLDALDAYFARYLPQLVLAAHRAGDRARCASPRPT